MRGKATSVDTKLTTGEMGTAMKDIFTHELERTMGPRGYRAKKRGSLDAGRWFLRCELSCIIQSETSFKRLILGYKESDNIYIHCMSIALFGRYNMGLMFFYFYMRGKK